MEILTMNELETLLSLEQQNPNDDKLLSQIAFAYLTTPYIKSDELIYFKKAYQINPNIKNTHNYAFWAYYEYGEVELALGLFKELIAKNPKSFYPYMAYANLLFKKSDYSNTANLDKLRNNLDLIIELYEKALQKFSYTSKDHQYHQLAWIYNNLANFYLVSNNFEKAKNYYQVALEELNNYLNGINNEQIKETYCFVLQNQLKLYIILDDLENAKKNLALIQQYESFDNLDIAYLYTLIGDFKTAYQTLNGEFNFHFTWDWLCYAIWQTDKKVWQDYLNALVEKKKSIIKEYQDDLTNCQDDEKADIQETIQSHQEDLIQINSYFDTPPIPKLSAKEQCLMDLHYFYKCWLFGCESCGNLFDDGLVDDK